jgi:hypothetical protein
MATGLGQMGTASAIVESIFLDFCPPGVRHNARKNSKFEFLKSFTLGCQHTSQDSKDIFVEQKDNVLRKSYLNFGVWSLFQIQTLADV